MQTKTKENEKQPQCKADNGNYHINAIEHEIIYRQQQ